NTLQGGEKKTPTCHWLVKAQWRNARGWTDPNKSNTVLLLIHQSKRSLIISTRVAPPLPSIKKNAGMVSAHPETTLCRVCSISLVSSIMQIFIALSTVFLKTHSFLSNTLLHLQ